MERALSTLLTAVADVVCATSCRRDDHPDQHAVQPAPAASRLTSATEVKAAFATASLPADPDDPAIWIHPTDPSRSSIIGTMKVAAPAGAIVVYGVDGQVRQTIASINRPNNVDVEYGFRFRGRLIDLAVATERLSRQLRVFEIDRTDGHLIDLGGVPVLQAQQGEDGAPMGIALYRRERDGELFAIVAPKTGPREGYLWQYRLADAGNGSITATFVRRFGIFSASTIREENEIEGGAVDDTLGYVYYADEADGIHKWHADPDQPHASRELAHFARSGFRGDREGIAIYALPDGTGYIVCTDQLDGNSEYHVYRREGEPGKPHDHSREIVVVRGGADATDGLDISSRSLGPTLPHGVMIAMNSRPRNFLIFPWESIARAVQPPLRLNTSNEP